MQLKTVANLILMSILNMTKLEKLIDKLLSKPKDFTWAELAKLLAGFGYEQIRIGKTGGSRMRFVNTDYPPIVLHRPHPKLVLRRYQLEEVINLLKQEMLV
jgi:hypothetical protein